MYFRFPVKYIVFAVFAVAVLAAEGWRRIPLPRGHDSAWITTVWLPAIAGGLFLAITLWLMAAPSTLHAATQSLALVTHLKDAEAGAEFLARVAPPLALRTGALLVAAALLAAFARQRPYAWWLLAGIACGDLLVSGAGLNPTLEVARLSPPSWFTAASSSQRLYIGGRVRGYMNGGDPDGVSTWQIPAEATAIAGRMLLNSMLPMAPSGWRVREALSYDLPYLWPAEYEAAVRRFEQATPGERDAFLRRAGVRWCVLPEERAVPWRAIADVRDWNMRVFECHADASRLAFVSETRDLEAMFDPSEPDGEPLGEARFTEDGGTQVSIEATASRPAILVLRDSFDPSWHAEIDGRPVPVLRANSLYRAVALPPAAT
jgi:hypothetical protein